MLVFLRKLWLFNDDIIDYFMKNYVLALEAIFLKYFSH
jgi:hypothetical protein